MKHFDNWQWADFVRGLGDASTRSMMQSHLSSGCARLPENRRYPARRRRGGQGRRRYAPPEPVIRYAHALYTIVRPEK